MILAIDIGNTTTNFGVFEAGKLKSQPFDSAFGLAQGCSASR